MNHTTNYQLNQWAKSDRIRMDDFNADNQKIDAALAACGNCKIATGSYTGTGEYGKANPSTLTFDFVPKFVLIRVLEADLITGLSLYSPFTLGKLEKMGSSASSQNEIHVSWEGSSVSWFNYSSAEYQANESGCSYAYLAIG